MPCRPPQSPPIAKFMIANWALSKSQPAPPLPSPRQVGTSWRPASRKPTGAAPPANRLDLRHSRGGRGSAYASPLDLVYSRRIQTARTLRIARARPRPGSPKVARGRRPGEARPSTFDPGGLVITHISVPRRVQNSRDCLAVQSSASRAGISHTLQGQTMHAQWTLSPDSRMWVMTSLEGSQSAP